MLFIMRGTSCSGKDRFISKHFPNKNHILSSDDFRELVLGDISSQQYNKRIFELMYEILEYRFLNRVNWTVLNATNLRIRDIAVPIELCKTYQVPFTILSIQPPEVNELKRRNEERSEVTPIYIPDDVLERHYERYETAKGPFLKEAIYNPLCTWIEISQDWEVLDNVS